MPAHSLRFSSSLLTAVLFAVLSLPAEATLTSASKTFSPASIAAGATATITVSIVNDKSIVSSIGFTDTYPTGLTNTSAATTNGNCGATPSATVGGSSLTLSGGSLAGNKSCTITVSVTACAAGSYTNPSFAISSSSGTPTVAAVTLTVNPAIPTAANSTVVASPASVAADGSTTSTVTVTLKDGCGNVVPGKAVSLTAGSGSSSITAVSSTTNAGGVATFTVKDSVAESVTYTAADTTDTITVTQTATVTFTAAVASFNAFETSTAAGATSGRIYTKLAGTAFGLDVAAITGGSQATSFSGNVKAELLANTGTAGSGYGADNCPTSNSVIQTIASTAIAGGRSTVNFSAGAGAYRDVRVRISYPTASPTITICGTDSFAIRPGAVTLAATPTMATPPSASSATTIKAGASFTLTATTTTAPGDGYGGTLTQDASLLTAQITSQDTTVASGGVVGTLSPATLTANATPSNNASYSEVGYLYLPARAYRDASFTAVDQSGDCVANSASVTLAGGQYGCDVGNVAAGSMGRFIPDHFAVGSSTLTAACTSSTAFTYFGQDGFTTVFTLTAQNAANGSTQNYSGVFAKLNLGTYASYGFTAASLPAGSSLSASATTPSGTWSSGVAAAVSAKHQISRPTAITGPTTITVSAAPTDGEVPAAGTPASLGSATLRYGRLQLLNAYGSELLALPVTLRAQYWNGSAWVTNADDSCTTITAPTSGAGLTFYPEVAAGVQGNHLSATETAASVNATGKLATGAAGLRFSAPGSGNSGYVDISIPLLSKPWLQFPWGGGGNADPSGRATFGIYKSRLIYSRENY